MSESALVELHGVSKGFGVGNTRVEVLKNRLGPSGRTATITIGLNDTVRGNGL